MFHGLVSFLYISLQLYNSSARQLFDFMYVNQYFRMIKQLENAK